MASQQDTATDREMLKDATDLSLEDNDSQRLSGKQGNQVNIYFFHLFFQCHYNFAIIFNFVLSNINCFYLFKINFLFVFRLHFVGLALLVASAICQTLLSYLNV